MEVKRIDVYDFTVALNEVEFNTLKMLADKKDISCETVVNSLLQQALKKFTNSLG